MWCLFYPWLEQSIFIHWRVDFMSIKLVWLHVCFNSLIIVFVISKLICWRHYTSAFKFVLSCRPTEISCCCCILVILSLLMRFMGFRWNSCTRYLSCVGHHRRNIGKGPSCHMLVFLSHHNHTSVASKKHLKNFHLLLGL